MKITIKVKSEHDVASGPLKPLSNRLSKMGHFGRVQLAVERKSPQFCKDHNLYQSASYESVSWNWKDEVKKQISFLQIVPSKWFP